MMEAESNAQRQALQHQELLSMDSQGYLLDLLDLQEVSWELLAEDLELNKLQLAVSSSLSIAVTCI